MLAPESAAQVLGAKLARSSTPFVLLFLVLANPFGDYFCFAKTIDLDLCRIYSNLWQNLRKTVGLAHELCPAGPSPSSQVLGTARWNQGQLPRACLKR